MTEELNKVVEKGKGAAIVSAFNAIEGFAMFSVIAFGIIQMGSLYFKKK